MCESEKYKFERNTECKSETLDFVGLYWVELSVCIIPPIIYNLLPLWTYPILRNHVNLLVCVLFVFAFDPVCTTNWYKSIREARTLKKTCFSALGLKFERDDRLGQNLVGYVDSDYAGDLDNVVPQQAMCLHLLKGL